MKLKMLEAECQDFTFNSFSPTKKVAFDKKMEFFQIPHRNSALCTIMPLAVNSVHDINSNLCSPNGSRRSIKNFENPLEEIIIKRIKVEKEKLDHDLKLLKKGLNLKLHITKYLFSRLFLIF